VDEKLFKAYELYLLERTRLTTAKQEASKSYDRTILTFSGGAIALSITFLEKIAPQPDAKGLLYTSWSLLAVAMMSTLYSLLATQRACEQEISDLEKRYEEIVGVSNDEETAGVGCERSRPCFATESSLSRMSLRGLIGSRACSFSLEFFSSPGLRWKIGSMQSRR
jgi:hypothetical protein